MVVSSRQLDAVPLEGIVVLVHATNRLAKLGGEPVECILTLIVRVHDHVADLVVGLADDSADLTHILYLLDLVLNHELACLNVSVEPYRIQPERSDDGHEQLGKVIQLTNYALKENR